MFYSYEFGSRRFVIKADNEIDADRMAIQKIMSTRVVRAVGEDEAKMIEEQDQRSSDDGPHGRIE